MARPGDFDWAKALSDPGYFPARGDVEALFGLVRSADKKLALKAEKALMRLAPEAGAGLAREVGERLAKAGGGERARLVRLAGRLARGGVEPEVAEALRGLVLAEAASSDAGVRRQAYAAMGGFAAGAAGEGAADDAAGDAAGGAAGVAAGVAAGGFERALAVLLAATESESRPEILRALASALGSCGDARAQRGIERLAQHAAADPELARLVGEGRTKLARLAGRGGESRLDLDTKLFDVTAWLHVRRGLEEIARDELPSGIDLRIDAPGRLVGRLSGVTLRSLFEARTLLRVGFPLAVEGGANRTEQANSPAYSQAEPQVALAGAEEALAGAEEGALERLVVDALSSPSTLKLVERLTGTSRLRYRIEWAAGGRRRGLTMHIADGVARLRPGFVNDPSGADWELVVHEAGAVSPAGPDASAPAGAGEGHAARSVALELWPRGLDDVRFRYRVADVPAASHPTLAAALARVAGTRPDDVVWDPFVGSACELVERARLGAAAAFYGTDTEEAALAAARRNLGAAGVTAELACTDARKFRPRRPITLVLTNPPMGRRVLDVRALGGLFEQLFAHARSVMATGGRFVWLSPFPRDTERMALEQGFLLTYKSRVDMGGFWAELQRFELGPREVGAAAVRSGERHVDRSPRLGADLPSTPGGGAGRKRRIVR